MAFKPFKRIDVVFNGADSQAVCYSVFRFCLQDNATHFKSFLNRLQFIFRKAVHPYECFKTYRYFTSVFSQEAYLVRRDLAKDYIKYFYQLMFSSRMSKKKVIRYIPRVAVYHWERLFPTLLYLHTCLYVCHFFRNPRL